MRLQMNDTEKQVIDNENYFYSLIIDWEASFNEEIGEYFYRIFNSKNNASLFVYYGNMKRQLCLKDFRKLLSKGAKRACRQSYIDEQEKAHWKAVEEYGLLYTILAGEHSVKH